MKRDQPMIQQEIVSGVLPRYVIIFFVKSNAVAGQIDLNPFEFPHLNILESYAKVNGLVIGTYPLKTDFEQNDYLRAYNKLIDGTTIKRTNHQHYITEEHFKEGQFLQIYDLSPDQCFGTHLHEPLEGTLTVHYTFKSGGITESYRLFAYCVYHDFYELDAARNVVLSNGRPV